MSVFSSIRTSVADVTDAIRESLTSDYAGEMNIQEQQQTGKRSSSAAVLSSLPTPYEVRRENALTRLYKGVDVRNRRYRFKNYKRCFIGSEAVDFMVESGWARNREHAVEIGQNLQKEFKLFEHVAEPERHLFDDSYLFFKLNTADASTSEEDDDSFEQAAAERMSVTQSLMNDTKKIGLISVGEIVRRNLSRKYNFNLDKKGFNADEAVDYLVSIGLGNSREDATAIGRALQLAGGIIQNAKSPGQPFTDSRTFFFFTAEGSVEFTMPTWKKDLQEACDFFQENIKRRDHTFRLKTYKDTFTGKEAVDLLLAAGITNSRQDAVLLGRAMMVEYGGLFNHVCDDHEFEDSDLFYKFREDL
jgi:hypothetical protein